MKTEISKYEKQAIDFLSKTGTEIKIEFLKHAKHFSDDKDKRDIYKVILTRGRRGFSLDFGQSLNKSGIKIINRNTGKTMRTFDPSDTAYIKNGKLDMTKFKWVCNWQFSSCDKVVMPEPPTAYDILACLTKYDPGTLEDFCDEFGYDTDSKKADAIYKAVKEEFLNVCSLFNDQEIEELAEIQ